MEFNGYAWVYPSPVCRPLWLLDSHPALRNREYGEAADFLQLSAEESPLIEIRLSLAQAAKQSRVQHALSQTELAKRMTSSRSRIVKIEAANPSVSKYLMVRALLAGGAGRADVARALRKRG